MKYTVEFGAMLTKKIWILSCASVLMGCATIYNHPTKGEREWAADYSLCEAQAGQASPQIQGYAYDRVLNNCLFGKGWTKEK